MGTAPNSKPLNELATVEQDTQIVELKRAGNTFEQIAGHLGISKATAHRGFYRALRRVQAPGVEAIREDQLARIEQAREILNDIIAARHLIVSNGQIVRDDGEPLPDDAVAMNAIALRDKLDDREAKLTGAYPETKVSLSGGVRYEVVGIDTSDLT